MASQDCQKVDRSAEIPDVARHRERRLGPLQDLLQRRALGQDALGLLGVGGQQPVAVLGDPGHPHAVTHAEQVTAGIGR